MANASFVLEDASCLFHNAAGLARLKDPQVFFAYEKAPQLPGADRKSVAVLIPLSTGALSFGAFRFGDQAYSEQFLTAAFSHRIDHTALGLKTNYLQYRTDGLGVHGAFTIDVSGLTQLTPEWSVGAGIFNVTQTCITPEEPLPVILAAATGWKSRDGMLLVAEVEKKQGYPLSVRCGMEITVHKKFFVRSGIRTEPLLLAAGMGTKTSRLTADFATTYQAALGFFYQASASYRISKKESL